jgi:alginate biosynthesis protein AlgX
MKKAQPNRLTRYLIGCVFTFFVILEFHVDFGAQAQAQSPAERCAQAPFVRGLNGWLFRDYDFTPTRILPEQIMPYVVRLNNELKNAGVTLVLLPIPTKAAMLQNDSTALSEEQFTHFGAAIEASKNLYKQSILELESRGIRTIDLLASVPSDRQVGFFFKTDHHWSPDGAQLAAQATKLKLEQLGLAQLGLSSHPFETQIESQRMFEGSALSSFRTYCTDPWPAEPSVRYRTSEVYQEANDLLGDQAFDVVLAGTSNSAPERDFNFPGFLEQELQTPVLTYAQSARWLTGWLAAYLTSEAFRVSKPRFLIWEFPLLFWTEPGSATVDYVPWFRHFIPSVTGACSGSKQLEAQKISTIGSQKQYSVLVNTKIAIGDRYYVHVDTGASESKKMTFLLDYKTGESEQVKLDFSDRSDNNGQFYVELLSNNAPLERFTITPNQNDWPSELRVQLCAK